MNTLRDYTDPVWRRLSAWAERLSTWLHPGWRIAPLTTGRVMRFHHFLKDCGFDDAYEALGASEPAGSAPSGLAELADQMEGGPEADVDPDKARDVAGSLRSGIIEEGRLVELNQILFDVSETEARKIPTDMVEVVLADFLIAWLRHLSALMGTASATKSTSSQT